jgi:oxalate decarboxylase/phosphoglucose isomerase-like protein (cupin superfamily)
MTEITLGRVNCKAEEVGGEVHMSKVKEPAPTRSRVKWYDVCMDYTNVPKHLATRSHDDMKPVLMYPDAPGPATHYYMIRGGSQQRNVTVWEPGTVGGEYIKAYGHYHVDDLPETYWITSGQGIALLQKMEGDDPARLAEFKVIPVKAGDQLDIPIRYGHLVVNTGTTFFVTTDDSPVDFGDNDPAGHPGHADYSMVEKMKGFAYYVVEHEGAPALVKNPAYTSITSEDLGGLPVVEQ